MFLYTYAFLASQSYFKSMFRCYKLPTTTSRTSAKSRERFRLPHSKFRTPNGVKCSSSASAAQSLSQCDTQGLSCAEYGQARCTPHTPNSSDRIDFDPFGGAYDAQSIATHSPAQEVYDPQSFAYPVRRSFSLSLRSLLMLSVN